jgi:AraC-like DNA-binding protein
MNYPNEHGSNTVIRRELSPFDGTEFTESPRDLRKREHYTRAVTRAVIAMSERLERGLSNEEIAEVACFSPFHFNRIFRQFTGIPPVQFLYALRLQRAKDLLILTEDRITDICFEVGYESLGTFTTRFGELVGTTPTAFRQLARRLAGLHLADFRPTIIASDARVDGRSTKAFLTGMVEGSATSNAIVFTGLFHRAIPEGQPVACDLSICSNRYRLTVPGDGLWHALSIAAPWDTELTILLSPGVLARGRSRAIDVRGLDCSGDSTIILRSPYLWDPPILAALPLLFTGLRLWTMDHALGSAGRGAIHELTV